MYDSMKRLTTKHDVIPSVVALVICLISGGLAVVYISRGPWPK